jgi:hypothetical protein
MKIDAEERKFGQKKGLETLVFQTVNDEWLLLRLDISYKVNT